MRQPSGSFQRLSKRGQRLADFFDLRLNDRKVVDLVFGQRTQLSDSFYILGEKKLPQSGSPTTRKKDVKFTNTENQIMRLQLQTN